MSKRTNIGPARSQSSASYLMTGGCLVCLTPLLDRNTDHLRSAPPAHDKRVLTSGLQRCILLSCRTNRDSSALA
jgi:hypothetical protein